MKANFQCESCCMCMCVRVFCTVQTGLVSLACKCVFLHTFSCMCPVNWRVSCLVWCIKGQHDKEHEYNNNKNAKIFFISFTFYMLLFVLMVSCSWSRCVLKIIQCAPLKRMLIYALFQWQQHQQQQKQKRE